MQETPIEFLAPAFGLLASVTADLEQWQGEEERASAAEESALGLSKKKKIKLPPRSSH